MRAWWVTSFTALLIVVPAGSAEELDFAATGGCFPSVEGASDPALDLVGGIVGPAIGTVQDVLASVTPSASVTPPFTEPPIDPTATCGSSQMGNGKTDASSCQASSCNVTVVLHSTGWSSAPWNLQLAGAVILNASAEPTIICSQRSVASASISCGGYNTVPIPVNNGTCNQEPDASTVFNVQTKLQGAGAATEFQTAHFASIAGNALKICRDPDGTPHLSFFVGGAAPAAGFFLVLAALAGTVVFAARNRRVRP